MRRKLTVMLAAAAVLVGLGIAINEGTMRGEEPKKAAVVDVSAALQQATNAFKLQNYNEVIRVATAALKGKPSQEQSVALRRLVGISQVRLNKLDEGVKTLTDLVAGDQKSAKDAEILETIARGMAALRRQPALALVEWHSKAAAAYAADGNAAKQVELLLARANYLRENVYSIQPGPSRRRNQAQFAYAVSTVLSAYDAVLAIAKEPEPVTQALYGKARALQDYGHQLLAIEAKDWPGDLDSKYDLRKPFDTAIAFEREIIALRPDAPAAAAALLRIGQIEHANKQDFVAAVRTFRELTKRYPRSNEQKQALAAIDEITAPRLNIQGTTVVPPGTKPNYFWNARNIKQIDFAAYPVDLFDVIQKVNDFAQLDKYGLANAKPMSTWTLATGDQGTHQFLHPTDQEKGESAPLTESNAYLLVANATGNTGKKVEDRTLVLVSRLGLSVTQGTTTVAAFAVDCLTGKPHATADLLVQWMRPINQTVVHEIERVAIPDSGLATIRLDVKAKTQTSLSLVIARHGKDYAVVQQGGRFIPYYWRRELIGTHAYCYTDRPVYRPLQTANFRLVLRNYLEGGYITPSGKNIKVKITDSKGATVYEKQHVLDDYGTSSGSLALGESPALGQYHINLEGTDENLHGSGGQMFRVEEYKKPDFEVKVTATKPTYKVGEPLEATIHGEYYFGGPVANAEISYTVHREALVRYPIWRSPYSWYYDADDEGGFQARFAPWRQRRDLVKQGTLKTDEHGNAVISVPTEALKGTPEGDLQYHIEAKMVDQSRREINGSQTIKVTHKAFTIELDPAQHVYRPKDRVRIKLRAANANGQPVQIQGKAVVAVVAQREERDENGNVKQPEKVEELSRHEVKTAADGAAELAFDARSKGYFKISASAPDPYGGEVASSVYVWVAEGRGEFAHLANRDLELVPDRETYKAGETMHLLITSKHKDAYLLLTAEQDDIYMSRVLFLQGESTTVDLPIERNYRPNVTLRASLFRDNQVFQDEKELKVPPVEEFLTVKLSAPKEEFRPRETAEVEITATDYRGEPVQGQFSLGVVDASVFYIQKETRGDVRKFFHGRQRPRTVQTATSFAFNQHFGFRAASLAEGLRWNRPSMEPAAAPMETAADAAAPRRALAKARDGAQEFAATEVRSEFPDTVLWLANVVTGSDGKAKATLRFPDSLTTWRLTAIGATKGSAVGEVIHEVRTKKNIIVRLEGPRFFVERDKVILSAIAHNYLAQPKTVRVTFEATGEMALGEPGATEVGGASSARREIDVVVPPGGEKRVDIPAVALRPGKVKIVAQALTDAESDAVRHEYPIYEYGAEKLLAASGVLFGTASAEDSVSTRLLIPAEIRPGSQRVVVKVTPTVAGVMLASIPYLLEYPYGCTEQTMSRFLPAVLASNTLQRLGVNLGELRDLAAKDEQLARRLDSLTAKPVYDSREMQKIIKAGVDRLADFQKPDGGWGWWKNDESNPYVSAYVVSGLAIAKDSGVALPAGMIERGVGFLASQVARVEPVTRYPWQRNEDVSVRVAMLYALGEADRAKLAAPAIAKKLADAFAGRDALNDYSRALLALALEAGGKREEAQLVLANIKDRVRLDAESATASWGQPDGYYYWYQSGTEATSYSLRALLAIEPASPLVPQAVSWLMRHRRGTRWYNTKDTAIVCYALADYLKKTNELDPDLEITIDAGGGASKTIRVTRQNLFTLDGELELAGDAAGTGEKLITISRRGKGNLYWSAYTTFFTKEEKITEAGNELFVSRSYEKLIPKTVKKTRKVYNPATRKTVNEAYEEIEYDHRPLAEGDALASGDLIEVVLNVDAKNNFEYLVFEDPKPAGCESTELTSGFTWGGGFGAHVERRDELTAFFATYVNQGKHRLAYRLRAEAPGVFHALPARGECMYAPTVRGNAESRVITITAK